MEYRVATADDVTAISALHAESWRLHYRGGFPDEFLDGDVGAERLAVWTARLADPSPRDRTVVAMEGPELAGFVHTILDDDPEWGALLDNLHVRSTRKRRGTGACLLRRPPRTWSPPAPGAGCTCGSWRRTSRRRRSTWPRVGSSAIGSASSPRATARPSASASCGPTPPCCCERPPAGASPR